MALGTRYSTIHSRCCYCGIMFSANWMERHKKKCTERIKKVPIEQLNRKEAREAGRIEEWKKALYINDSAKK